MSKSKVQTKNNVKEQVISKGEQALSWFKKNYSYFIAFALPVILLLIAYAAFGIYPFGKTGSVLALDLNGQYIYYFEAIRDAFWGDGGIFYNWSRNLSGEFMGIIGYYLASPFTLIPILLPRTMILESIMIMQACKLGAAGLAFNIYVQKSREVKPLPSLMFSTAYALMAYAVIQTIDPMWLDGLVFLPLVALGIERFIDDGKRIGYIIPLALMFVSNFYIGFMIAIFTAIYYFCYLFLGAKKTNLKPKEYVNKTLWFGAYTGVVLMCSAIMLMPVYNALALGKFEFSGTPDYSFTTQFSPVELIPCLFPNQYYSVNMHGKPEIYCGMITVTLLPFFYMNKEIHWKKKLGYSIMLAILFISMYIKPLDMMWHGGQTPNWLPYRYSFLLSFVLVSMAATTFSKLEGLKLTIGKIAGVFIGILAFVLYFDAKMPTYEYIQKGDIIYVDTAKTFAFGMALIAVYLLCLFAMTKINKKYTVPIIACIMTLLVSVEACINAYDSFNKIDTEVAYSSRTSYYETIETGREVTNKMEEYDDGLYRSEKTFFRCVNDNLAYGLKGISHSSSVMNTKIINFIETMGYSMRSYVTRYDGNTPLADSLLGIKYVVDDNSNSPLLNPNYNVAFNYEYEDEGGNNKTITVYENPDALSIGYMVDEDILKLAHLGNDNPFNSQNMFLSTISGNTVFTEVGEEIRINWNKEYYRRIETSITTNDITESAYGEQRLFTANTDATDPVINIHFTAKTDNDIYMYLKTENEKGVNTWISSEKDENGNFINHDTLGKGSYFENHDYSIVRIGSFEPGTDIEVRLTVRLNTQNPGSEEYTIIKDFLFYEFDDEMFKVDVTELKQNQWQVEKFSDTYIKGTITAEDGQIMLTTIPTEPGWTIKVDGKKVEATEILQAFIGIELSAGEHTVTMRYTPPGFVFGTILLIAGVMVIVFMIKKEKTK